MKLRAFFWICLLASSANAQFSDVRIDLTGNVVNTQAINFATGKLKINNVAVTTGGGGGAGTVTNTGGNLTANSLVLGAGTVDTKVAAGLITDGTSKLILGVAGASVGSIDLKNA